MNKRRIKELLSYIFADKEDFTLEHRLLLSTIIVGTSICMLGGVTNFILSPSPVTILIPLFISISLIVTYYFVRFKKIVKPFLTPIIIVSIFGNSTLWIFNGGMDGSNIMIAFIILILGILIVPEKMEKYVIIFFLVVNSFILLIQLYRPDLIINFPSEKARWVDNLITLIYSSFFIFLIIRFVHKNYTLERLKAEKGEIRLHQLNIDKDRFISILGHDLKNPFNNILGFSEILTNEIESLSKNEIKEMASNINKSAQITSKLLEDILMWTRTQQGSILFNPKKLNVADICKNVIEVLNPAALVKGIAISYTNEDQMSVSADKDMVKTILLNLVSNAIKFTHDGGVVNISAERKDSRVIISVSDNGIGILPENIAKLFDISEVLTTKGTAGESGTGLGLLLCKEFVEKHGGKIWVESEVGSGSDFKFTLPLSDELAV
jgi:signal transduction histidine kinase